MAHIFRFWLQVWVSCRNRYTWVTPYSRRPTPGPDKCCFSHFSCSWAVILWPSVTKSQWQTSRAPYILVQPTVLCRYRHETLLSYRVFLVEFKLTGTINYHFGVKRRHNTLSLVQLKWPVFLRSVVMFFLCMRFIIIISSSRITVWARWAVPFPIGLVLVLPSRPTSAYISSAFSRL